MINTIGIGDHYRFGVEIEFAKAYLMDVYPALITSSVPIFYQLEHKSSELTYHTWYLDMDPTVTESLDFKLVGGELSSRILTDTPEAWHEIKAVCDSLRKQGAISSNRSSIHITIDVSKCLPNPVFFETLSKVLSIYEVDMDLFFMGDSFLVRETKEDYAANMSSRLLRNLSRVDFSSSDFLKQLLEKTHCFQLHDGVSFYKLGHGLMEIRYPNGTLKEETIQNDINFTLKLLKAIEEERFPMDYLNWQFENMQEDPLYFIRFFQNLENPESFLELIDIIGDSSYDKEHFEKQYQKVLKTRNQKRSSNETPFV